MVFNWQEFLTTIGGQTVLLAAVGYLIKTLVSSRFEREADAFKAELKRNSDIEIERLKSTLQMTAIEHQVRFSTLHGQRMEIIQQLSKEISEVPDVVTKFVLGKRGDPASRELELTQTRLHEFRKLIQANRIILPPGVCILLDDFWSKLWRIVTFVFVYWTNAGDSSTPEMQVMQKKVMTDAVAALDTGGEISELREKLTAELRKLLTGTSEQ